MSLLLALAALLADPAAAVAPPAPPPRATIERCGYRVVQTYPHDPSSFTQGLFWDDGHL